MKLMRTMPVHQRRLTMERALVACGVPRRMVYCDDRAMPSGQRRATRTWTRFPAWEILECAKAGYKRRAKRCHPDAGGDCAEMAALNAAWRKVRTKFEGLGITT